MSKPRPTSPPTPIHVLADLEFIRDRLLDVVMDEYRWAYNLGWDRRQRGEIKTRSTSHADPTQDIVLGQNRVRKATHDAAEKVRQARGLLQGAMNALARAHALNDANHIIEELPTPNSFSDQFPPISARERKDAEAAQRRREERGEGWGVA